MPMNEDDKKYMTEGGKKAEEKDREQDQRRDGRKFPDPDTRYSEYRVRLKNLTIMSDIFGRNVLKDLRCTEYILRIILNDKNLKVIDQTLQADFKNLHGRGVVLDCLATDNKRRKVNIEFQQGKEGAHPKRARYHLGLIDSNILDSGQNFDELPESYVIFITQRDALGKNLPILHLDRMIRETGEASGDQTHFIYVDASKQDNDTELGRLMHDLNCRDASDMHEGILAERVHYLKETERGVEQMCKEMDELCSMAFEDGKVKGKEAGRREEKMKVVKNMNNLKMSIEQIAQVADVDIKTVREWIAEEIVPA